MVTIMINLSFGCLSSDMVHRVRGVFRVKPIGSYAQLYAEANFLHFKLRYLETKYYSKGLPPIKLSRLLDRSYSRVHRRYDLMRGA